MRPVNRFLTLSVAGAVLLAATPGASDVKKRPQSSSVTQPPMRTFIRPDIKVDGTGKNPTATFFLTNVGQKDSGPFQLSFSCAAVTGGQIKGCILNSVTVAGIKAGQTDTRMIPASALPAGATYYVIIAKAAPAALENNTGNNQVTVQWPCSKAKQPCQ